MTTRGFQESFSDRPDVPFAAGSVRGLRAWTISSGRYRGEETGPSIVGLYGHQWGPGENVATCARMKYTGAHFGPRGWFGHPMVPPPPPQNEPNPCDGVDPECTCGFYAYWGAENLHRMWITSIVGVIDGYGRVTIGSYGFRCQKARVLALAPHPALRDIQVLSPMVWPHGLEFRLDSIRSAYPGVPVYGAMESMLEAFPTDAPPDEPAEAAA